MDRLTIRVLSPEGKELIIQNDKVLIKSFAYLSGSHTYDSTGSAVISSAPANSLIRITLESNNPVKAQCYDVGKVFKKSWEKEKQPDQWERLSELISERDPKTIAVNRSVHYGLADGIASTDFETFFINSLDPKRINKHELAVLSFHEGIPGHHYENYLLRKSDKPLYYKISDYTAYSEGWALYCEGLLKPKNNFELFWQLIYNLHRCVRLVLDTGIHYYNWTYERSFQFMKQYLPFDDEYIKNEIERYISDPGQAITYKIGELLILELRKEYLKKKRGDYKGFHNLILKIGPCPLHILKQQFSKYKRGQGCHQTVS